MVHSCLSSKAKFSTISLYHIRQGGQFSFLNELTSSLPTHMPTVFSMNLQSIFSEKSQLTSQQKRGRKGRLFGITCIQTEFGKLRKYHHCYPLKARLASSFSRFLFIFRCYMHIYRGFYSPMHIPPLFIFFCTSIING